MSTVRNYDWLDWSDGWKEYLKSEKFMEDDNGGRPIHKLHLSPVGDGVNSKQPDSTVYCAESLRSEWRDFVSSIVLPELAVHSMRFITLTFRDIRGKPPTLTAGRRALERLLAKLQLETDSFVFVEERGAINDRLHYHGCIRLNIMEDSPLLIMSLLQDWKRDYGFFKFDEPDSNDKAISYTAKYVAKGAYKGDTGFWAKKTNREVQMTLMEAK